MTNVGKKPLWALIEALQIKESDWFRVCNIRQVWNNICFLYY